MNITPVFEKALHHLKNKLFILFALLVFLVYWTALAPSISWSELSSDSGELAIAAAKLGIAHPPAYPAYILIAHLWQKILFFAEPAYALNVFSAFCTSLATYFLLLTLSRLLANHPLKNWMCLLAGVSFAFAPLIWANALVTEVYASSLAWHSAIFYLLSDSLLFQSHRKIFMLGFFIGFAAGINPTICTLYLPVLLVMLFSGSKATKLLILHVGLLLGLCILLYIPLIAATNPIANWGRVNSLERFIWLITAAQYHQFFGLKAGYLSELFASLKILLINSQLWGLVFFLSGLKYLWRSSKQLCLSLLFILLLAIHQYIFYPVEGRGNYLLPAILVIIIVAAGSIQSLTVPGLRWQKLSIQLIMICVVIYVWLLYPYLDRSKDSEAWDFGQTVLEQIPADSLILTDSDRETFPLWYVQYQIKRDDVIIIDTRLLQYDWYRENLAIQYPHLDPGFIRLGGLNGLGMDIFTIEWGETGYRIEQIYP